VALTKIFPPEQFAAALESWEWIGVAGKTPVAASLFGDVFLEDAAGYWFLDSVEGTLTHEWESRDAMTEALGNEVGQDRFLLAGLAIAAERSGIALAPNEIYDFAESPAFGGDIDIANVVAMDFVVSLNIAGQLHNQIRDLPDGTEIGGVILSPTDDTTSE
jgi:hypothetical protein